MATVDGSNYEQMALLVAVSTKEPPQFDPQTGQYLYIVRPIASRLEDPETGLPANPALGPQSNPYLVNRRVGDPRTGNVTEYHEMRIPDYMFDEMRRGCPSVPMYDKNGLISGEMFSMRADVLPDKAVHDNGLGIRGFDRLQSLRHQDRVTSNGSTYDRSAIFDPLSMRPGPQLPDDPHAQVRAKLEADRLYLKEQHQMDILKRSEPELFVRDQPDMSARITQPLTKQQSSRETREMDF